MNHYWQVALPSPPFTVLTYHWSDQEPALAPRQRVVVPVRGGLRVAVCLERVDKPEFATRSVVWPLEQEPVLDADWMAMAEDMATRQMMQLGQVLSVLLPSALRTAQVTFAVQAEGLPRVVRPGDIRKLSTRDLGLFRAAWESGAAVCRLNPRKEAEARVVSLAAEPPWPVRPRAVRQQAVLEYLYEHGPTFMGALSSALGAGLGPIVDRLEAAGLVKWAEQGAEEEDDDHFSEPLTATDEQRAAIDLLAGRMDRPDGGVGVVHGVTGSGKTHIYLELVERALESGRSCLLLAPEVALAMSLMRSVRARFGPARTRLYHGYQSPALRQRTFLETGAKGDPLVVVGTRSALFLPMRRLGLVIIDEEHDESYKQEERLPYQAKEVAFVRVRRSGGLLVLGSATPDVKTYHAACSGKVPVVRLENRVGQGELPEVELADISAHRDQEAPLAPEVERKLLETVEEGHQAIVMLNRRGYSPVMYCVDCGEAAKCPSCDVGLTYHKGRERLVCHYCGLTVPYPSLCAGCGGATHLPMGGGTERVEEYLDRILPDSAPVLRLDRDSTRRQERMEDILADFSAGRARVLVGTQMLSKGHHFPGVTLVVVADGDLGLNLPDYRSAERTFQLLVQVSGRAGRGNHPGRVVIQTRNPAHPFWADVLAADYESFYRREIEKRERFGYPPFSRLALVRLSHPADDDEAAAAMAEAGRVLGESARQEGVGVLGPAPAPLARLRNRRRFNCLLKGSDWHPIRIAYARLWRWNPLPGRLRLSLDLDPVNML